MSRFDFWFRLLWSRCSRKEKALLKVFSLIFFVLLIAFSAVFFLSLETTNTCLYFGEEIPCPTNYNPWVVDPGFTILFNETESIYLNISLLSNKSEGDE